MAEEASFATAERAERPRTRDGFALRVGHGRPVVASLSAEVGCRYITRLPGVRSGAPIVEGTRIGVHDLVGLIISGATVDEGVRSFPELKRAQVFECPAYYEDHREEVDWRIAAQMAGAEDDLSARP